MANYLYNGVELPDINEVWTDKETKPYAQIVRLASSRYAVLFSNNSATLIGDYSLYGNYYCDAYSGGDFAWLYADSSVTTQSEVWFGTPVWANFDILAADGSVYLAASDPVPVVETPEAYSSYIHNGTWQKGTFYKRVNNAWVKHQAYKRQNGAWVTVKE